ncbi:hypothetical protein CPB86DRAFT_821113, partial [Serendipita vermifera]
MSGNHSTEATTRKGVLSLFLRSHPKKEFAKQKAQALSPDIITRYKEDVTVNELVNSYDRWMSESIVPRQENKVYVRGLAVPPSSGSAAAQ